MFSAPVNLWAVVVAAVANMAWGYVWYGPLFGQYWTKLMGFTKADMEKGKAMMGKTYTLAILASLVTAYVLAHFIIYAGEDTYLGGMKIAFWAWIGFVVTKSFTDALFEGKKWELFYLSMGYQLVAFLTMGAILAVWK